MTPLVLCADDFGLHEGVDAAVLELAAAGRLTATSCMTVAPRWPQAAAALTPALRRQLAVGLHLDLTEFGGRLPLRTLAWRALGGRLDDAWLDQSIARQLDAFEDALGVAPDYVDGHQHVHQLRPVRARLLRELARRYPSRRPWLRVSRPPPGAGIKGAAIGVLGARGLAHGAAAAGFRCSQRLLGIYGFDLPAGGFGDRLRGWLAAARPGDVLMLHPAVCAPADDPIGRARRVEHAVLSGPEMAGWLAAAGVLPAREPGGSAWR